MHERGFFSPLSSEQLRRRNSNPMVLSPRLVSPTLGQILQRAHFTPNRSKSMGFLKETFNFLSGTWHDGQSKDFETKPSFWCSPEKWFHCSALLLSIETELVLCSSQNCRELKWRSVWKPCWKWWALHRYLPVLFLLSSLCLEEPCWHFFFLSWHFWIFT